MSTNSYSDMSDSNSGAEMPDIKDNVFTISASTSVSESDDSCSQFKYDNHFDFKMGLNIPYITDKHLKFYSTGQGFNFDNNYENKIRHFINYYFTNNYGKINRVDVVKRANSKGTFYCAFVHFVGWRYNKSTIELQYKLNNNISAKFSLYFPPNEKGWFWYLRKHTNPEQYNNPEYLLKIIKKQELQISELTQKMSQMSNCIVSQELPRKRHCI